MVAPYFALLTAVAVERLIELRISRRNREWALAHGGFEVGQQHFGWMRVLHIAFLVACAAEVWWLQRPFDPAVGYPMLAIAGLAQALRYWAIRTLGNRWNVRVVVVPGEPVITSGPYRFVRHPNYLAVILEGIALPMIHGAWWTAVSFSLLNACLLAVRIRCEENALRRFSELEEQLGDRRRLLPMLPRSTS